jgi:hypothetical protein
MIVDYGKLKGQKVKIVCVFGDIKNPIYYDGTILDYDAQGMVLTIKDRYSKTVLLDTNSVRQVVIV